MPLYSAIMKSYGAAKLFKEELSPFKGDECSEIECSGTEGVKKHAKPQTPHPKQKERPTCVSLSHIVRDKRFMPQRG